MMTSSPRIETVTDGRVGRLRITEADRRQLEKHLYRRYPGREWGTFVRLGWRRTPWGVALAFAGALWPEGGALRRASPIVDVTSAYSLRAVDAVQGDELAIGFVHSHPQDCGSRHSELDDDMDGYYAGLFGDYAPGRPYASLVFSRGTDGAFRFSGRVHLDGEWLPLTELRTVGEEVRCELCETWQPALDEAGEDDGDDAVEATTARLRAFLSQAAGERLRRATVAVIGCSGTGSPAVEVLARAGVGGFILVDPQRLAPSNLERVHGSTRADVTRDLPPYKVEVMARLIGEIDPAVRVAAWVGNLLDEEVLDELLRADVILNCTDTQHSRAVLGDLANHHLLPSLDVGVLLEGEDGRVRAQIGQFTWFRPGSPCAFCGGMLDDITLAHELMAEEEKAQRRQAARVAEVAGADGNQYWRGEPPALLTVGYLTSTLGSMAAGYVIGALTGTFTVPHPRFQFDLTAPELGGVSVERTRRPDCACGRPHGRGDQARADRSVSRPTYWPEAVCMSLISRPPDLRRTT